MAANGNTSVRTPLHIRGKVFHITMILVVLFVGGFLSILLPKKTVSENEKRYLSTMPDFSVEAFFSGTYFENLSLFYADTFPARDLFLNVASVFRELGGLRFDNIRIHETIGDDPETSVLTETAPPSDDTASLSQEEEKTEAGQSSMSKAEDTGAKQNGIFVYGGKALQIFGGKNSMGQWYAETVNRCHQSLGDEVKVYCLVVPSPIEFALPQRYQSVTVPEREKLDNIHGNLNPGITWVDVYENLKQNYDSEYLYYNTDHHWTALGAYRAYQIFAEASGEAPVALDQFEKRTIGSFLGTLYAKTQDSKLAENPDYVDYYIPATGCQVWQYRKGAPFTPVASSLFGEYARGSNSYSVFLHGDLPLIRIDTEQTNGKSIAVVKESYGNAFVPFLVNHYQHIYVIDERYFELNLIDFVQKNQIQNLLFINNIFAAHTSYQIGCLEKIMNQNILGNENTSSSIAPSSSAASSSFASETENSSQAVKIIVPEVGNGAGEDK